MGRRRTKSPAWLPKRVYPHGRQLLYHPKVGKPVALGPVEDPGECLRKYAEIVGTTAERPRTIGDVIDRYLVEIVPTKAESTQETYRLYCGKLRHAFGHMLPDEITINHLYEYHAARKAPTRANREITILGVIYRHAIRWRAATRNPTAGFLFSEERPREREVRSSERRAFRQFVPNWMRGYLTIKHLTGRRQGELLKLGLFSERKDGIAFRILKKRRYRELVIEWTPRLRRAWEWCKRLPRPDNSLMLWHGERRKPVTPRGFKSAWQRAMARFEKAGGEHFWEHDLRAASAGAAATDERARELLDHSDVRTTRRSYRRKSVQKVRPLR